MSNRPWPHRDPQPALVRCWREPGLTRAARHRRLNVWVRSELLRAAHKGLRRPVKLNRRGAGGGV